MCISVTAHVDTRKLDLRSGKEVAAESMEFLCAT